MFMFMVILLWAEVEAQRCAATLPVGETWGSKGKGGRTRRGITRLARARRRLRVCTRLMTTSS
ncbi:hypothetical protein AC629_00515 [Bradyrhizobium sp. NAS80.1]|nr:hypothetical protein AC629_00515 [Bradyrhizobium sp. NAS80.1]